MPARSRPSSCGRAARPDHRSRPAQLRLGELRVDPVNAQSSSKAASGRATCLCILVMKRSCFDPRTETGAFLQAARPKRIMNHARSMARALGVGSAVATRSDSPPARVVLGPVSGLPPSVTLPHPPGPRQRTATVSATTDGSTPTSP